jgi:hypothetical protein
MLVYWRGQNFALDYREKLIECLPNEPFVGGMVTNPKPRSRVAFENAQGPIAQDDP